MNPLAGDPLTSPRRTLRVLDPERLDPCALERLRAQLLELQRANFQAAEGAEDLEDRLVSYVDDALARRPDRVFNRLSLTTEGTRVVCVAQSTLQRVLWQGRALYIARTNVNTAPDRRGHGLTTPTYTALLWHLIPAWLRRMGRLYATGEAMSPVSYAMAHRWFPRLYPSPEHQPDAEQLALYDVLYPGARAQGGRMEEAAASSLDPRTRRYLTQTEDPYVRFYLRRNPGFERGEVMPTLSPIGPTDLWMLSSRHLRRALRGAPARDLTPLETP